MTEYNTNISVAVDNDRRLIAALRPMTRANSPMIRPKKSILFISMADNIAGLVATP